MRYYVYLSESKLEMLATQVDGGRRGRWEIEGGVRVAPVHASVRRPALDPTVHEKLDAVLAALERQGLVGTVDDPKAYFRGTMPLRWGRFGGHWSTGDVVYFGGTTGSTILGLGGSAASIMGHHPQAMPDKSCVTMGASATPYLLAVLSREFAVRILPSASVEGDPQRHVNAKALIATMFATVEHEGPEQTLEFVAKRLLAGPVDHHYDHVGDIVRSRTRVLLGSPLYVTLAD